MMEDLRTGAYEVLALGFRRPTPDLVEALAGVDTRQLLSDLAGLLPVRQPRQRQHLGRFCEDVETRGAAPVAEELLLEYCRLFLGPGTVPCPPYGSVYLNGGRVMGPSAIEAASCYRQAGLRVVGRWKEPPDHIAVELAFMARLSARCLAAVEAGHEDEALCQLDAQREFLCHHLGRWGPLFAERLVRATSCSLYRLLGEFLPAWLAFDADLLDDATAAPSEEHRPCA